MKNNLSIVLNAVLAVAVVILYILHFTGKSEISNNGDSVSGSVNSKDLAIAYVNSDSLLKNYDFFKDLEKQLLAKGEKLNVEYKNRAEGLQREITNFQSTAGNMTISQAKAVEEDLRKKQQNLMMYQEQLSQQLMGEEAKLNSQLYDKVSEYLGNYGRDMNLQIVLTYTKGSGVLYANDSLDITNQIIVGLNEAYQKEQNGGIKSKGDSSAVK